MSIVVTYADADTFIVVGDRTDDFHIGCRVRYDCESNGIKYRTILGSAYGDSNTTVNLTSVKCGIVGIDTPILFQHLLITVGITQIDEMDKIRKLLDRKKEYENTRKIFT